MGNLGFENRIIIVGWRVEERSVSHSGNRGLLGNLGFEHRIIIVGWRVEERSVINRVVLSIMQGDFYSR